jgi:hypothetical protein
MTSPSPTFQSTAERLILDAAKGRKDAAEIAGAAEHVFQSLHDHLATLIGAIGFRTLLARSIKLARPGARALERIEVQHEGTLAGLAEALSRETPEEALAAPAMLLARFLDLLAAFVGDDLALHLVDEATRARPAREGGNDDGSSEDR